MQMWNISADEKKVFKYEFIVKQYKNDYKRRKKEQDPNSAKIRLHHFTILIDGGFGFEKTNALLNLINHEPFIDEIYFYSKDQYVAKYQLPSNKKRKCKLKVFKWFIRFY